MAKNKEELIQQINKNISKEYRALAIDLIQPAIRLYPLDDLVFNPTVSKIGGFPHLPKSIAWPRTVESNIPYSFILQINLSAIEAFALEAVLPKEGMLYFFLNLNVWDDAKVIYYNGDEILKRVDLPPEFLNRHAKIPFWKRFLGIHPPLYHIFEPFRIKFEQEYQIPAWDSIQVELFKLENELDELVDIIEDEDYYDEIMNENVPNHHLLGYYWSWQEASYEFFCISQELEDSFQKEDNKELLLEAANWILLFQLDTEKKLNMHWADGGKILFFIHQDDLKKRDFSKVVATLDTA